MGTVHKKQINKSLNVVKCLAMFAIICIHCGAYGIGMHGAIVDSISRFAVPIFFLISGFFSYFEDNDFAMFKYKTRIIKLIKLYIVANILYFILNLFIPMYDSTFFDFNACLKYIVFNVSPTMVHLWFIIALMYCYVVFFILGKFHIDYSKLFKFVPILLIIALILGEFSSLWLYIPPYYYRNFLFIGLPFFILGYFIKCNQKSICDKISNIMLYLTVFLSCMLIIFETLIFGKCDFYAGAMVLAVGIFIWCVKNPYALNFKVMEWIGRNLYTSIYVLHYLVIKFLDFYVLGFLKPFLVFFISIVISTIVYFALKYVNGFTLSKSH